MRAVQRAGWRLLHQPAADEYAIFDHPFKPGAIVNVNPDWDRIHRGSAVFECLRSDMGVSERKLLELMSNHG